jgi:dihydrofolate reductase
MSLSMIAAIGRKRELGKKGGLIWQLPGDLQFFKRTTLGHPVLMGLATWKSLPGKLPGREHFVLAFDATEVEGDVTPVTNLHKFLEEKRSKPEKLFVIGGGSVYAQALPYVDELYLTEIDAEDAEADTYFPEFDPGAWTREVVGEGADHGVTYQHVRYKRK